MKQKLDLSKIAEKRQLILAWLMITAGGVMCAFFALVLVGFLISPDKLHHLPAGIMTVLLLGGGVLLIRGGRRERAKYESGKAWTENPQTPMNVEALTKAATEKAAQNVRQEEARHCESCGAVSIPDESGCCEYCGAKLR